MNPSDKKEKKVFLTENDLALENYILRVKSKAHNRSIKDSAMKFIQDVEKIVGENSLRRTVSLNARELSRLQVTDECKAIFKQIADDLETALDEIHELIKEEFVISTDIEDRMETFIHSLSQQKDESITKRPMTSDGPVAPQVVPHFS
ncbi:hypothetical protein K1X84_10275 [bacterium]|nr:hypothetical protein [bacterium]